jgi:hypothetical protein
MPECCARSRNMREVVPDRDRQSTVLLRRAFVFGRVFDFLGLADVPLLLRHGTAILASVSAGLGFVLRLAT